ncbi:hypothetical protein C0J52_05937 [Blattella germanica]|nr:hypothetical protein C0J52_05937 [Blattella germanica]
MAEISGKIALITGAAHGIGLATAQLLMSNGAKGVAICDVDTTRGEKAAESINKEHGKGRAIFIKTDVTKPQDLEGKTNTIPIRGVIRGTNLGIRYMDAGKSGSGGTIVNIASVAGLGLKSASPVYDGSKYFVVGFTRSIAGVAICDVNSELGEKTVVELQKEHGENRVIYIKTDVRDYKQFEDAFKKTKNTFGALHIVVNNAGIFDDVDWLKEVDINLNGVIRGILLSFDHMGKRSGSVDPAVVVNISSITGLEPIEYIPIYSGIKHGVVGLTRAFGVRNKNIGREYEYFLVTDAFRRTKKNFGQLNIVVNNAGIFDDINWEKEVDINLKGVIRGILLSFEHMGKKSGGDEPAVVVNMSSTERHFERTGVRVAAICPGYTRTNIGNAESIIDQSWWSATIGEQKQT